MARVVVEEVWEGGRLLHRGRRWSRVRGSARRGATAGGEGGAAWWRGARRLFGRSEETHGWLAQKVMGVERKKQDEGGRKERASESQGRRAERAGLDKAGALVQRC